MRHNKSCVKGKFIVLTAFIKKLERSHMSNLIASIKALKQKEANTPKRGRQRKITKPRTEINQLETKQKIQMKSRAGSLRKSIR